MLLLLFTAYEFVVVFVFVAFMLCHKFALTVTHKIATTYTAIINLHTLIHSASAAHTPRLSPLVNTTYPSGRASSFLLAIERIVEVISDRWRPQGTQRFELSESAS